MSSQINETGPLSDKGSTADADRLKLSLITLYSITVPLALVGNILVIYVLYKRPETRRLTSFMYVNLAVADLLLTIVVMPQQLQANLMQGRWLDGAFGEFLAKFVFFTFLVSQMASIYFLTAIAFDSFFSIVRPMQEFPRFRNKNILVPCIWFISMCCMSPSLIIVEVVHNGQFSKINYRFSKFGEIQSSLRGAQLFLVITIYVLPLSVMCFLYGYICKKLTSHTLPGASLKHDKARLRVNKTKRRVISMSIAIMVAFALCWFPMHMCNVMMAIDYRWFYNNLPSYARLVCLWCGHANSAVNPWMLIYFKKRFRAVFHKMITYPISRYPLSLTSGNHGDTVALKRASRDTATTKEFQLCTSSL